MNALSRGELNILIEQRDVPCISIFLPTARSGTETLQNPMRLKNQLREAENHSLIGTLRAAEREDLLNPIQELLKDNAMWQHPSDGLAIFRSPALFRYYRLPFSPQEQSIVTQHFYVKPLLPFFSNDGRFYILALSQNDIRLLIGTRYNVSEVELPDNVPESLTEALKYDQPDNQVSYYSSSSGSHVGKGGRRPAIFYGKGIGIDDSKDNILRYFQQIDRGLHELLHEEKSPLVLAGVEYLLPIYREANSYPYLLEQGILGSPDKLKAETLHIHAWALVEPEVLKAQQEAADRYREYVGTERASGNISEIVPAAFYGRIESLFVAIDQEQWGTFDPATQTIDVHQEAKVGDDDLLDVAATQALLHGGAVYAVEEARVPDQGAAAAVFRY